MLLSSLREVISKQVQEIQTLQKNVTGLTASNKSKDEEVYIIHRSFRYGFTEKEFRLRP
jgi:hypothetical protein